MRRRSIAGNTGERKPPSLPLAKAVEVFVRGFAFTRSFTHPYFVERLGRGAWAMRDAPRARGDYRKEEFAFHGVEPAEADRVARSRARGRFALCAIVKRADSEEHVRAAYRDLGYRLMTTEALMAHDLEAIETPREPFRIVRVTTIEEAERLAKAARRRQILPAHLAADPPPMRQYMALDAGRPIGWVGSVVVGDLTWCANLFVAASHRRRGVGRSLMARMLADDKAAGAKANVLTASHAGELLYRAIGYETIGRLLAYAPGRREGPGLAAEFIGQALR